MKDNRIYIIAAGVLIVLAALAGHYDYANIQKLNAVKNSHVGA